MGLMQRLFGPKRSGGVDDTDVRTIDWDPTPQNHATSTPSHGTILIDSPDSGPEVAEIKPIGVVVPRNKQELMEELRKNYADVIELVRKVNTHLDDQGARLTEQESRGRELVEIARQIPALLATLPKLAEQNVQLLGLVERLANESAIGNESLRTAIADQTRATGESAAAVTASISSAAQDQRRAGEALGATINSAITSSTAALTDQLVGVQSATEANARTFDAARIQLESRADELRKAMDQHRTWSVIATVIGVCAIIGTAVVAVVLLTR